MYSRILTIKPPLNYDQRVANFERLLEVLKYGLLENQFGPIKKILEEHHYDRWLNPLDGYNAPPHLTLGFMNAPAAKGFHHAWLGGLVAHLLEMWEIHQKLKDTLFGAKYDEYLGDSNVLMMIVLHDLHKGMHEFIAVDISDEASDAKFEYIDKYVRDRAYQVPAIRVSLKKEQLVFYTAQEYGVQLSPIVYNALLAAEGGWSSNPPPADNVLAKYAYILDELSGNVLDRINSGRLLTGNRVDVGLTPYA